MNPLIYSCMYKYSLRNDGLELTLFVDEGINEMGALRDDHSLDLGQRGKQRNSVFNVFMCYESTLRFVYSRKREKLHLYVSKQVSRV